MYLGNEVQTIARTLYNPCNSSETPLSLHWLPPRVLGRRSLPLWKYKIGLKTMLGERKLQMRKDAAKCVL
jgi:hypothetical protein